MDRQKRIEEKQGESHRMNAHETLIQDPGKGDTFPEWQDLRNRRGGIERLLLPVQGVPLHAAIAASDAIDLHVRNTTTKNRIISPNAQSSTYLRFIGRLSWQTERNYLRNLQHGSTARSVDREAWLQDSSHCSWPSTCSCIWRGKTSKPASGGRTPPLASKQWEFSFIRGTNIHPRRPERYTRTRPRSHAGINRFNDIMKVFAVEVKPR